MLPLPPPQSLLSLWGLCGRARIGLGAGNAPQVPLLPPGKTALLFHGTLSLSLLQFWDMPCPGPEET